ncbi:dTDP-4-dehydrorhamnose 3,5-epimerase [Acetoanaerobium pronyense]|uniref:dTDP-4-dehydrorhamnose 3,5-epimerase n=1 Tax=Acetoanaerobium pronyense TaxID=1482736 RepID=A0ABS4KH73_9FIRM|nr:dTDP-4-dehydrorhamnose 3,5-epimerase [Acetoanaerobium pronyense]MBP2027131.1 dTDP-4-dehydrorhamnose 3,5-epimerase [Acetoanaerobium pronyense]
MNFEIKPTKIQGLIHIQPKVFGDERGYFLETYNKNTLKQLGFEEEFVQDNESKSKKGVLRGLHFQTKHTQGKLVRCTYGKVLDVAVDLRKNSPTYGHWESAVLDSNEKNMFYVPTGFAHGFLVLTEEAVFNYKCTDYYAPEYDGGIKWDDPQLNIDWKLKEYGIDSVTVSEKDLNLPYLEDLNIQFERD